ncbi:hypothetical protein LCGC14_0523130 [marine sediment metagenome]|uniref:Uncharacterized protein n=1 Tax=marine sediment metagenome TaxID=412755 RepID=A0A0F9SGB0_9ZZZZ
MVERFQGSGRVKEGGFLATHKRDFLAHTSGGDYKHPADHITMNPALANFSAPDVQGTLVLIAAYAASSGTGFVSVGKLGSDGYAAGTYNDGSAATPTFREALIAAIADDRLQNGGVVFILSGTYKLNTTVDVPAGISIMGEIAGSIINGEMIEQPMFKFSRSIDIPTIGGNSGSGELSAEVGAPIDESRLLNITLTDNLDGYIGSTGQPDSTMQTVPMVQIEKSARVYVENVKFIGRVNNGAVPDRGKTLRAIGYTSGSTTGSYLTVKGCFFDGLATAINFGPGEGDEDHLIVDGCRARTFGSEASGIGEPLASDCFVAMSECNAILTNNYHIGVNSTDSKVSRCFVVESLVSGAAVRMVIAGNSGAPSDNSSTTAKLFDSNVGIAANLVTVQYGNNWGGSVGNDWVVTVGENADGTGDNRFSGDFYGAGAIDLLLNTSYQYPTTVIVNPGTYTITENGNAYYKFIGNKVKDSIPIFEMDLGAGAPTDGVLSNRAFKTGPVLESIHFRSNIAVTSSYHSIMPQMSDGTDVDDLLRVTNCVFENCTLSHAPNTTAGTNKGNISVINSQFKQTGDFSDGMGILLPRADNVVVEGCVFTGNGLAGAVGSFSTYASTAWVITDLKPRYILRDCSMSLHGSTVSNISSTNESYFRLDDADGDVLIDNCQIVVSNDYQTRTTAIDSGIVSDYFSHVYVRGDDVDIRNSTFHSPDQMFTESAADYPLPGVEIHPQSVLHMSHSSFIDGGIACKIGGLAADLNTNQRFASIDNCSFFRTASANKSTSIFDVELDPTANAAGTTFSVTNCTFSGQSKALSLEPYHPLLSGYTAHGTVQIFARNFIVNFKDNTVTGGTNTTEDTLLQHGVVVINNFDDAGETTDSDYTAPINVFGNTIHNVSSYTSATATDNAAALWVRGPEINISNNSLTTENKAASAGNFVGCLCIDNRDSVTGSAPPTMVSSNSFGNTTVAGAVSTEVIVAYIRLLATCEADGSIINNTYSSPIPDGTTTTTVQDDTSSLIWIITQNKNQTDSCSLRGQDGTIVLGDTSDLATVGLGPNVTASFVQIRVLANAPIEFTYDVADAGSPIYMQWLLPLFGLIPYGTTLIDATVDVIVDATPDTVKTGKLAIIDKDFTTETLESNTNLTTGSTHTLNGILAGTFRALPGSNTILYLQLQIHDSVAGIGTTVSEMTITYRW